MEEKLTESITKRYSEEASSCCSLSCGNALSLAEVKAGEILVDLGSGRGMDVIRAARIVGDTGRAIGVDFTDEMLRVSESNKTKLGLNNVEFKKGRLDSIPLPDHSCDLIISNCTINHAPDKRAVFREMFRILKSQGRIVISDVLAEEAFPDSVRSDPDAWAGCYGGAIVKEEYLEAVRKAGFSRIDILEESAPYEKGGVSVLSLTFRAFRS